MYNIKFNLNNQEINIPSDNNINKNISDNLENHNTNTNSHTDIRNYIAQSIQDMLNNTHTLQRNKSYNIGDIAYSTSLPSYGRLECVIAGITNATMSTMPTTIGTLIKDGTCTWILDDVRDGHKIGEVVALSYLPDGYIKADGATVNRSDYSRLVSLATKYSLWTNNTTNNLGMFGVGNGTTMVLPNWIGKMAQFAINAGGTINAGLPNIIGQCNPTLRHDGARIEITEISVAFYTGAKW